MWQIGLNFHNSFALALPRRAILAFRSIPAVGARIVAIASIAPLPRTIREMFEENYSHLPQAPADGEGNSAEQAWGTQVLAIFSPRQSEDG
jgi:hypothetical protein